MPLLYSSRQHKRDGRESLDCAVALQTLMSKNNLEELSKCDYYLLINQLYILKNTFDNYFKGLNNE